jgi:hypothetical protein
MKLLLYSISLLVVSATAKKCGSNKELPDGCFKGRLEVKANCMNYTISIIEGAADTSLVAAQWTDENTGKMYKNAFALDSRCNFPPNLNAGDEFYFKIDSTSTQNCPVCLMYYPVPHKRLGIKVLEQPCDKP